MANQTFNQRKDIVMKHIVELMLLPSLSKQNKDDMRGKIQKIIYEVADL